MGTDCFGTPQRSCMVEPSELDNLRRRLFANLKNNPGVVGVGEIGLDYHGDKNFCARKQQQDFLQQVVQQMMKDDQLKTKPIVLHVRGRSATDLSASNDCIRVLQRVNGLARDHPVYRHCFVGGLTEARDWLNAFPNTVFGLSTLSASEHSHDECATVFKSLDECHIVLETDSPYLPLSGQDHSTVTPWSTYYLAKWLAGVREIPLAVSIDTACNNMCWLYQLPPPCHNQI